MANVVGGTNSGSGGNYQIGSYLNWAGLGPTPGPLQKFAPDYVRDPIGWLRGKLGGGSKTADTYASDTFAALTRQQWADYTKNFIPIENQLIDYATDPTQVTTAMQRGISGVQSSFANQQAMTARQLKGRGVTLNPDEQAAANRERNLSQSLAEVGTANIAGQMTLARQRGILGAPTPDISTQAATVH